MKNASHRILLFCLTLGLTLTASGQTEEIVFSAPGGFYETSFPLSMGCFSNLNLHIRYTTNGATPNAASQLYEQPLWLDQSLYSHSDIYTILTCPPDLFYLPDSVQHCIVIRAAVFDENDSCVSKVATNSYFIKALGCDTHGLPAISLCADSLDLFGYEQGIMIPGIHFDSLNPNHTGNYYQKGKEWERVVNMEYCDYNDNSGINQTCGLRTHGNRARRQPQKGLKIYAREEYGNKRFHHQFFETSPINSFKHLAIKPFSSLYPYSGIQDYICSQTAIDMGLESGQSRPVVLYLNGEYWGIYFLQEKMDERYLEDHFNIDIDHCHIVGNWSGQSEHGGPVNGMGNDIEFEEMMDWLETADLSQENDYQHICELVDIDNFIDYIVLETFIANNDWPANNMRCWKMEGGKWRWMFFDGDAALNNYSLDPWGNAIPLDVFGNATYTGNYQWPSSQEATLLFRRCLENNGFVARFETRMSQLCHDVLAYENTGQYYAQIKTLLQPEIAAQSFRFGKPSHTGYWNWACTLADGFLTSRVDTYNVEYGVFEGIEEPGENGPSTGSGALVVYPNPANDVLFVETRRATSLPDPTYRVTNMMGQTLLQGTITEEIQQINVASLHAGMYFVSVGGQTIKFVVK